MKSLICIFFGIELKRPSPERIYNVERSELMRTERLQKQSRDIKHSIILINDKLSQNITKMMVEESALLVDASRVWTSNAR